VHTIVLKAERLAVAVHLVTDFVPEGEFLRLKLRERSLELLSDITQREKERAKGHIQELVGLIAIGKATSLISEMNASILYGEYRRLEVLLSDAGSGQALTRDFFDTPVPSILIKDTKGQYKRHTEVRTSNISLKQKGIQENSRTLISNRKEIIFDLLKKKTFLTVKDVALVIKDCSEKTLQRELLTLVGSGALRKEGERRWSRYFLPNQLGTRASAN